MLLIFSIILILCAGFFVLVQVRSMHAAAEQYQGQYAHAWFAEDLMDEE